MSPSRSAPASYARRALCTLTRPQIFTRGGVPAAAGAPLFSSSATPLCGCGTGRVRLGCCSCARSCGVEAERLERGEKFGLDGGRGAATCKGG